MLCIHHFDHDGKAAAFMVKKLGKKDSFGENFFSINYGTKMPWDLIHKDEVVYIVDYSIPTEDMDKLMEITPNVVWIDHHKTAIEKYAGYKKEIDGLRYDGVAGCMLTWCYLLKMADGKIPFDVSMTSDAPEYLKLIADHDVYRYEFGERTRNFFNGFAMYDDANAPDEDIWEDLYWYWSTGAVEKIVAEGAIVTKYRKKMMATNVKFKGFPTTFEGKSAFALNCPGIGTADFDDVPEKEKYDMLIGFSFNGEIWTYALRSNKDTVDVSEIAKKYGGGGHKAAAGFSSTELLIKKEA